MRSVRRPPHRGAWIEIFTVILNIVQVNVAPRTGGRGLKFPSLKTAVKKLRRPPHRGAWIEIWAFIEHLPEDDVAPRTGGRGLKLWPLSVQI